MTYQEQIEIAGDAFTIIGEGVFEYEIEDGDPSVGEPKGPMIEGVELFHLSLDGIPFSRVGLVQVHDNGAFLISEQNMAGIEEGVRERLQSMLENGELDQ